MCNGTIRLNTEMKWKKKVAVSTKSLKISITKNFFQVLNTKVMFYSFQMKIPYAMQWEISVKFNRCVEIKKKYIYIISGKFT